MNFEEALKHYWPRAWFRLRFFKYKHCGRGEAELWLIRHLIAPGTVALDVGCSFGMYAVEMARYAAKVVAFEANPSLAALTMRVVPRNVEVVNVALSGVSGQASLRIPLSGKGLGISELATIEAGNPLRGLGAEATQVEMKQLDDFMIANCSFIKIDVEGHEEAVIDGASRLIAAERPILMAELDEGINPGTIARFAARCAAFRYRGHFLLCGKLHPIEAFEPALYQDQSLLQYSRRAFPRERTYINNFVFIPDEKAAQLLARL